VYDAQGQPTSETRSWEWEDRESAGAKKVLELSGPIIWTLTHGGVLVIDEIEASLHTQLTQHTVNLFLNPATNPQGAQLLFATHDTNLLTYLDLRRDQICFAEKNAWEGTETYALSDFQYLPLAGAGKQGNRGIGPERPDTEKEKRYLEGRYGAIPANADFQRFVAQHTAWPTPVK
jgi:AAA15 family ATPase/GTPase